jgi:hypothetical protein
MGDLITNNLGIIEMLMSGVIVLGFCAWQYWSVSRPDKKPGDD